MEGALTVALLTTASASAVRPRMFLAPLGLWLAMAILVVSGLDFHRTAVAYTKVELALVALVWTVLTVGFEFLVGYVEGTPVSVPLGQYDVLAGQVWTAVPLTFLVAPLVFGWYLFG